jgi:hypothetical protein
VTALPAAGRARPRQQHRHAAWALLAPQTQSGSAGRKSCGRKIDRRAKQAGRQAAIIRHIVGRPGSCGSYNCIPWGLQVRWTPTDAHHVSIVQAIYSDVAQLLYYPPRCHSGTACLCFTHHQVSTRHKWDMAGLVIVEFIYCSTARHYTATFCVWRCSCCCSLCGVAAHHCQQLLPARVECQSHNHLPVL